MQCFQEKSSLFTYRQFMRDTSKARRPLKDLKVLQSTAEKQLGGFHTYDVRTEWGGGQKDPKFADKQYQGGNGSD